jgi:hypothetical protein
MRWRGNFLKKKKAWSSYDENEAEQKYTAAECHQIISIRARPATTGAVDDDEGP